MSKRNARGKRPTAIELDPRVNPVSARVEPDLLRDIIASKNDWQPETELEPTGDVPQSDSCQFYLAATSARGRGTANSGPLDGLDPKFSEGIGWSKLSGRAHQDTGGDYVVGMQRPWPEQVPGSESRFVATDPTIYRGGAVTENAEIQEFWREQINIRPFSPEFLSSTAIWPLLGVDVTPAQTAFMMGLQTVDAETSDAVQAALFCAYNTARYPIDMETAAFVLGAFLHADPLRKQLVEQHTFHHPYGARTVYALLKVYKKAA
jgi:hypothetical protein